MTKQQLYNNILQMCNLAYKRGVADAGIRHEGINREAMYVKEDIKKDCDEFLRLNCLTVEGLSTKDTRVDIKTPKYLDAKY